METYYNIAASDLSREDNAFFLMLWVPNLECADFADNNKNFQ